MSENILFAHPDYMVASGQVTIAPWGPEDAHSIHELLEHPNWAPWLEASADTLAARSLVFPYGQLVMKDGVGNPIASLSVNQIDWDGDPKSLPNWDTVAGEPTDYSQTYKPDGNTLVLMSMNVAPSQKGNKLPAKMIEAMQVVAQSLGVAHLIGSFRPSGYGLAKKGMGYALDFEEYCFIKQHSSDKPIDSWLRSLAWSGMKMIAIDSHAMTVTVGIDEFLHYQETYKPNQWAQVKESLWECEEVGSWIVDKASGIATYTESNVWGVLPFVTKNI